MKSIITASDFKFKVIFVDLLGATTLSIMTLSIMTLNVIILIIMLIILTFVKMTPGIRIKYVQACETI